MSPVVEIQIRHFLHIGIQMPELSSPVPTRAVDPETIQYNRNFFLWISPFVSDTGQIDIFFQCCGSILVPILLFLSVIFKMLTKEFCYKFFCLLLFVGTFTSFFNDKNIKKR